ncbi:hypothetical protein ILUMI_02761 [Ignelater luminosus]|uniref:Peptidase S1 domain-containing protein n=1 Tax=Ignelater luminosus TaxID=2038154 RepID=A0A8K0GL29_IGNLU|nr:hypothetical protein ILUMI_02761 [Ignelater luminosus]
MSLQMSCTFLISSIIILLCLASSVQSQNPSISKRIVGGNDTGIRNYPSYCTLLYMNIPVCGCALLSSTTAVTSASCLFMYDQSVLRIQVGSAIPGDGGNYAIRRSCVHPQFNFQNPFGFPDYDAAKVVIDVWQVTGWGSVISAIALRSMNYDVPTGKTAIVVGFGTKGWGGPRNQVLQALDMPRIRDIDCAKVYPNLTDRMACFGYPEGGKDACGASGSPLYYERALVGVDSFSRGCAFPNTPRVFTRIWNEDIHSFLTSSC